MNDEPTTRWAGDLEPLTICFQDPAELACRTMRRDRFQTSPKTTSHELAQVVEWYTREGVDGFEHANPTPGRPGLRVIALAEKPAAKACLR